MNIQFERRGGFMGMRLTADVELDNLPAEEARALYAALDEAKFFELPGTLSAPPNSIDRFNYRIRVQSGEFVHAVEFGESATPDSMRPLLDQLTHLARTPRNEPPDHMI